MSFMISLAHFCDTHGPTSVICTQMTLPDCLSCFPRGVGSSPQAGIPHPHASHSTKKPATAFEGKLSQNQPPNRPYLSTPNLPNISSQNQLDSPVSPSDAIPSLTSASLHASALQSYNSISSPEPTPPPSPRSPAVAARLPTSPSLPPTASSASVGSAGTESCVSCSLILPKGMDTALSGSIPASPVKKSRSKSPTIRTKEKVPAMADCEQVESILRKERSERRQRRRIRFADDEINPNDGDDEDPAKHPQLSRESTSSSSCTSSDSESHSYSSNSSFHSSYSSSYSHQVTYLTTRVPVHPYYYTALRQACLKILSCDLMSPSETNAPTTYHPKLGCTLSGDPVIGHTLAYTFKLPDRQARGGRRMYALICWSDKQWPLMTEWKRIARCFEHLADRIRTAAEKVQHRDTMNQSRPGTASSVYGSATTPTSPSLGLSSNPSSYASMNGFPASTLVQNKPRKTCGLFGGNASMYSSNSSQRSHIDGRPSIVPRSLTEIVGHENFFLDIHAVFVRLLRGMSFGIWIDLGPPSCPAAGEHQRGRSGSIGSLAGRLDGLGIGSTQCSSKTAPIDENKTMHQHQHQKSGSGFAKALPVQHQRTAMVV